MELTRVPFGRPNRFDSDRKGFIAIVGSNHVARHAQISDRFLVFVVITVKSKPVLTNAPQKGGWCPIYGTLKGTGTLSGPFRFTGEDNCWEVTGASRDIFLNAVTFADADANALAGLKKLEVTFDAKPKKGCYELSDALGLTAETVGDVALTVTDAAGNDYADIISLTVEDGKLRLANPSAVRTTIIIRRSIAVRPATLPGCFWRSRRSATLPRWGEPHGRDGVPSPSAARRDASPTSAWEGRAPSRPYHFPFAPAKEMSFSRVGKSNPPCREVKPPV